MFLKLEKCFRKLKKIKYHFCIKKYIFFHNILILKSKCEKKRKKKERKKSEVLTLEKGVGGIRFPSLKSFSNFKKQSQHLSLCPSLKSP